MLVHVKRDELLAIAAQTAKAAPKTATSEAVLGIHVEADSRRSMLTLTATNYEIVIRASMGASVEQSGSVVISAALFPAAIASLPEQDVDLETEHPGQLTIRSGHARFRLSALSGDKYPMPELPFPDDTLPVSGLRSLARNTLFAVAEDGVPSLPMKCVRLHVGPDGLKASASNGFCIMEADGDKQCKGQIELLLPARSLKVLASLSNDSDVYDEPLHAMKFRTYEEAQAYIDTSSRSGQETAIVRRSLPPRILPGLAVELRLCSAAASRSRTACWRRRPAGFVSGDAKGGKTNESNTEKQDAHPDGGSPGTGGRA